MKKRAFLIILVLILTAVHASALEPETVADLYNDYAAVFSAPAITGTKEMGKFIQCDLENGSYLALSKDLTYVSIETPSGAGDELLRAAVSILYALSDQNDHADIISGAATAFLMLDESKPYDAGGFSCRIRIKPTGGYLFSAVKL